MSLGKSDLGKLRSIDLHLFCLLDRSFSLHVHKNAVLVTQRTRRGGWWIRTLSFPSRHTVQVKN